MVRILGVHIAHGFSSEGRVFASLLAHRAPDIDVLVLFQRASATGDDALAAFRQASGVTVEPVDTGWRPNPAGRRPFMAKVGSHLRFRLMLPAMLARARRFAPDVIYSNQQVWDCTAATVLARCLRRPQIIHLHYTTGPWLGRLPLRRLRSCDHVITVSDYIRSLALEHGVAPERVTTVHNTLAVGPAPTPQVRAEVRAGLDIPLDAAVIGQVGRLAEGKGQTDTIAAFARVAPMYPYAHLVLVGSGPMWDPIRQQVAATGLMDRIHLLGARSDVSRLLAAFDVFMHPSRHDPCPLAVLEAAAAGLPIVGYAEGGISELTCSGVTSVLAPPGDQGALAVALASLLADPDQGRRFGAAGRERVAEHFAPPAAGRRFARIVRTVAGVPSPLPATSMVNS